MPVVSLELLLVEMEKNHDRFIFDLPISTLTASYAVENMLNTLQKKKLHWRAASVLTV